MKHLILVALSVGTLSMIGCKDRRTPAELTDALFKAAEVGNTTEVTRLLDKGADVNGEGHPSGDLPLRIAAIYGHVECVRTLLNSGADPSRTIESGGNGGTTSVFRPIVSVQSCLYTLKKAKNTPPALLSMMHPSLKEILDRGVTVEAYEEILHILEEAERSNARTRRDDAGAESPHGTSRKPGPVPGDMVLIPSGTFIMGDPWDEGSSAERPRHEVNLSTYHLDKYEVTNAQYAAALNWAYAQGNLIMVKKGVVYQAGRRTSYPYCTTTSAPHIKPTWGEWSRVHWDGSTFSITANKEDHPMTMVSWYGSVAYCNWRGAMEGKLPCYDLSDWTCNFGVAGYRLPTEAEWEKAAGWDPVQVRHFRFGDHTDGCGYTCLDGHRANYKGSGDPFESEPEFGTTPVGYYDGRTHDGYVTRNAQSYYGCYDMSGNVFELCNDWCSFSYYSTSPSSNPTGPRSEDSGRVQRGGVFYGFPGACRSAARCGIPPDERRDDVGFRCALGTH